MCKYWYVRLLSKKIPYRQIAIEAGVSTTTVGRVARYVKYGHNGYNSVLKKKKGSVLSSNSQIIDLIKNDLNNNDYLMVKASNATGLNKIVSNIKGSN